MIILAKGKDTSILIREADLKECNRKYLILYRNNIYDPDNSFKCIVKGEGIKCFYDHLREEYAALQVEADKEFNKRTQKSKKEIEEMGLVDTMKKALIGALCEQTSSEILKSVMPEVREKIIAEFGVLPQVHEIVTPVETKKITGVLHEKFDLVLNLVNADIPTFLTGAAGTGKNVICKQIAESLGLEFYFTNAVTQEYKLTGFIDAHGNYHETEFYKAFKNGGLFFLDEMDASIPETLITLNAAIANRYFDFPNGKIEAHKDFRVIAAGNTYGTGADIEYSGRYQLDAASLDRFALVEIDYSNNIETALAQGDNELVAFADGFRKAINKAGIKHLVTCRAIDRIAKLKGTLPLHQVLRIAFLKNLEKDDINVILNSCNELVNNPYYKATKEAATK